MSEKEQTALVEKFYSNIDDKSIKISDEEFDIVMWNEIGEEATGWQPYYQAKEYTKGRFYRDTDNIPDDPEGPTSNSGSLLDEERASLANEFKDNISTDDIPFSKGGRVKYAKGGKGIEALRKEAPEVVARMGYEEGGDVDAQMSMMMPPEQEQGMMPDEDMEDGYVDFIVSQSLSPEEETQLMNKLEADPELSVMFDKVLDKATEFAGSGPVEGPGSGVSDSIPARLSDGEFVLTAAATKQIGADRLQRMMEDAEMQAGAGRQQKQEGGEVEETKVDRFGKPVDKDIAEDEIKKGMMSVNPRMQ